jgi:site-specific DNA recombinase
MQGHSISREWKVQSLPGWRPRCGSAISIERLLVDATARGHGDPAVPGPRSSVSDEARKQVARELNDEPAVGDVISLHPAALARYEQQLVHLQDALSKGVNAGDSEAA